MFQLKRHRGNVPHKATDVLVRVTSFCLCKLPLVGPEVDITDLFPKPKRGLGIESQVGYEFPRKFPRSVMKVLTCSRIHGQSPV